MDRSFALMGDCASATNEMVKAGVEARVSDVSLAFRHRANRPGQWASDILSAAMQPPVQARSRAPAGDSVNGKLALPMPIGPLSGISR
jgi:hypothetical protein